MGSSFWILKDVDDDEDHNIKVSIPIQVTKILHSKALSLTMKRTSISIIWLFLLTIVSATLLLHRWCFSSFLTMILGTFILFDFSSFLPVSTVGICFWFCIFAACRLFESAHKCSFISTLLHLYMITFSCFDFLSTILSAFTYDHPFSKDLYLTWYRF